MAMRPVCVTCEQFMMPLKNGVLTEECTEDGAGYKLWHADLYVCGGCARQVIVGFGERPLAEHYQADYEPMKKREPVFKAQHVVR